MKRISVSIAVVVLLSACSDNPREGAAYYRCLEQGVAYFKSIGSYPTLSDGRHAQVVAGERCERVVTAFDGLR